MLKKGKWYDRERLYERKLTVGCPRLWPKERLVGCPGWEWFWCQNESAEMNNCSVFWGCHLWWDVCQTCRDPSRNMEIWGRKGLVECHHHFTGIKTHLRPLHHQAIGYTRKTEENQVLSLGGHPWRVYLHWVWILFRSPNMTDFLGRRPHWSMNS